MRQYRQEKK